MDNQYGINGPTTMTPQGMYEHIQWEMKRPPKANYVTPELDYQYVTVQRKWYNA